MNTRTLLAIHAYFGASLDEGLDLSLEPATRKGVENAMSVLDVDRNTDSGSDEDAARAKALEAALTEAALSPGVELYAGNASGNNTMAELVGLYDTRNDEIVYFGFSNFGSDD